jgi:hypothetical protein
VKILQDYGEIKNRVAELASKRDRTGKKPLSNDERLEVLNEIYDGLLFFWKQCVVSGSAKGTSSISYQLERARLEMIEITKSHDVKASPWRMIFSQLPEEYQYEDDTKGDA